VSLGVKILTALSRDNSEPDHPAGTSRTTIDNCLDFIIKTVPDFLDLIHDKEVLDFGCGYGMQAAALARTSAAHVVGLDLPRPVLLEKWEERRRLGLPNLELTTNLPDDRLFDVVLSCSAFEHFSDPVGILDLMRRRCKVGGKVIITFAEPWLSPRGTHVEYFTKLPWVNVLFSERTVMEVRSRYRSDGAQRYEDIEGGLNRMTIARFHQIMHDSGMQVEQFNLFAVKNLPVVTSLPVVREFLTSAASCILRRTV
jgi:SAM-dependent methyltransferase